jgi:predicted transcriptional regulator
MSDDIQEPTVSDDLEIKKIVGEIAAAYFGNSHVTPNEIATVIAQIANSLAAVGAPTPAEAVAPPEEKKKLTPAQIRRSVTPDAIISFEDDKPYKTLRRHLASRGMTPDEYRSKWGLPRDYPMVAPSYSEMRSSFAKEFGLGARGRMNAPAAPLADSVSPAVMAPAAAEISQAPAPANKLDAPAGAGRRKATGATAVRAGRPPSVRAKGGRTSAKAKGRRTTPARSRAKKDTSDTSGSAE